MIITDDHFSHYKHFVSYALALGVPRDVAEDVIQDAFLRVLKVDFVPQSKGMDLALIFQNIRWCARAFFIGRDEGDIAAEPGSENEDMDQGVSYLADHSAGLRPTEFLAEVALTLDELKDIDRHFYLSAIFNLSKNQALEMLPYVFTNCDADIKKINITRGEIKRLRDQTSCVDFVEIRHRLNYVRGKWDERLSLSVFGAA